MKRLAVFIFIFSITLAFSQKPKVWLISDGGDNINDPDDFL
ncbi:hypothetical protein [Seonamhaeicola algicola]|nr:hypothetical protein [Seonamhaeicola algicola]